MTLEQGLATAVKRAKRHDDGALVTAFLHSDESGYWHCVLVATDLDPVYFWATDHEVPMADRDSRRDNRGRVHMVVVSTPPGLQPSGIMAVPVDSDGLPQGELVAVVRSDDYVLLDPADQSAQQRRKDPLRRLLSTAVAQKDGKHFMRKVTTEDGDSANVLIDWTSRPLLFWTESPEEDRPKSRMLAAAIVLPGDEGIIAVGVSPDLRPFHSDDWYRRQQAN